MSLSEQQANDLRERAERATEGPWEVRDRSVYGKYRSRIVAFLNWHNHTEQDDRNAAYIAAANPAVILALLEERGALRDAAAREALKASP